MPEKTILLTGQSRPVFHEVGPYCETCQSMQRDLSPALSRAFDEIRKAFPDAHLSLGFVPIKSQTPLHCPSADHYRIVDGYPAAEAFDLFRIEKGSGSPSFSLEWYGAIGIFLAKSTLPVEWAYETSNKFYDHFSLITDG